MKKNKKISIEFKTWRTKGLFISVPYDCNINDYKTYDQQPIGFTHKISENKINEIGFEFKEYLKFLSDNDITVSYSDSSNFWLVVVLND